MKRFAMFVAAAALTAVAWAPVATAAVQEEKTIKGELIDVKCHQGKGHEACATNCVRRGQAAGIKVGEEVYTIVGDFTAEKNAKLIEFVAKDVEATGVIGEADGHKTIKISKIVLAKAEKK